MELVTKAVLDFVKLETRSRPVKTAELVGNVMESFEKEYQSFHTAELDPDMVAAAIMATVRGSERGKDSKIEIFKRFVAFLKDKHKIAVEINWPPIQVSNTFERLMFIAKYLHDPSHSIYDLEEILWTSRRSLSNDKETLLGHTDDPIQIQGRVFRIEDAESCRGRITMASTVHPLFLTGNLTQILVLLKGLRKMREEPAYSIYAELMAASIWHQLSDYARNRVLYLAQDQIPDDIEWYRKLDRMALGGSFYSELMCSYDEGPSRVLDCVKNHKPCFIEYLEEDGTKSIYENCLILKYHVDTVTVEHQSQLLELRLDRVLRSTLTKEEILLNRQSGS